MKKDELAKGRNYALRPKGSGAGDPFVKVTFLGVTHGRQCRIRYDDGELEGLEEWVQTRLLVCAWGQRKAQLKDERNAARLADADAEAWDAVVEEAISAVMTASGEYGGFLRSWDTDAASAERYWARARLDGTPFDYDPMNYLDRDGTWHLSFRTALKAAQSFAAAEPELVDLHLRGWEEELKALGFEPGTLQARAAPEMGTEPRTRSVMEPRTSRCDGREGNRAVTCSRFHCCPLFAGGRRGK